MMASGYRPIGGAAPAARARWYAAGGAALCVAAVGTLGYASGASAALLAAVGAPLAPASVDFGALSLVAHNDYTRSAGFAGRGYPFLGEGGLLEPHRDHELVARDAAGAEVAAYADAALGWSWTVEGPLDSVDSETSTHGEATPTVRVTKLGSYRVSLAVASGGPAAAEGATASAARTFLCRYVRRSIRTLSDDDRTLFLDTFVTLTKVGEAEGSRLYGPDYHELDYFNRVHLERAAGRQNDALHDGMGFMLQHISLTDEFERSLQAVAPALSVPYWDYTEDYETSYKAARRADYVQDVVAPEKGISDPHDRTPFNDVEDSQIGTIQKQNGLTDDETNLLGGRPVGAKGVTPPERRLSMLTAESTLTEEANYRGLTELWAQDVWTDDWFGTAATAARTVATGRFAYQRVTHDASATVHNSYGYLRSPWNTNKSPFVTRAHTFCGFSYNLDWWPSCGIHYNITFSEEYDTWYDYAWAAPYAPHGPVHFMIGGYANCGNLLEDLGDDIPSSAIARIALNMINIPKNLWRAHELEAPTFCSADTPQNDCHMICKNNVSETMMDAMFVDRPTFGDWSSSDGLDDARRRAVVEKLCSTPWSPGEQMESASPVDVSFWPIHPTVDRLLQYRRIVRPFNDSSWVTSTDLGGAKACQYSRYGCDGHHAFDLTVSPTRVADPSAPINGSKFTSTFLSNGDLFHMLNPHEYRMSFLYDSFTWSHCDDVGVKFPTLDWGTDLA